MKKFAKTLGVASLVMTGSTVMMASAMADYNYQGNGNAYGHQPYTPTTTTPNTNPTVTNAGSQYSQYNYHNQNVNRYNNTNNGNHYGQYNNTASYNNGNHYGQYNQNHYPTQAPVINGRPQYNYRNAYPTRPSYPTYNHNVDYRYGYTSRPQWYGRMHPHEYQVLRREGRDYYYLEPNVYSTGVIIGRPQPGVVLMQYPDRTLEVIEATRLILDVLAR